MNNKPPAPMYIIQPTITLDGPGRFDARALPAPVFPRHLAVAALCELKARRVAAETTLRLRASRAILSGRFDVPLARLTS